MKNLLLVLFAFSSLLAASQVPQSLNYQAVARNTNGGVVPNQFISVEISIRDGSPTALIVYQEIDTATTNQFGLFTVAIGTGQSQLGNFTSINWATGNKYLQVGFDQTGGNNFIIIGTTELLSVPYALYAANSGGNATGSDYAVYSEMEVKGVAPQTVLIDSTWQPRQLNNTDDSAGTSITRNGYYITLQPGTYHISASAQWGLSLPANSYMFQLAQSLLMLADSNSNTPKLLGQAEQQSIYLGENMQGATTTTASYSISMEGAFTIAASTTVTLQHYISYPPNPYANAVTNAGISMGIGQKEIYARLLIQKIN